MPVLDHFGAIAPYYDRVFGRASLETLMHHVAPEAHDRVLDVGGGTGRVAAQMAARVAHVCVVDPSAGMLAQGRRKGLCATQGESEQLPYADASFDKAVVVDAFHHLRDQHLAAAELLRVVMPGGRIVVEEPDIAHLAVKAIAAMEKVLLMRSRFLRPAAIGASFAAHGAAVRVARDGATAWVIVEKGMDR